MVTGATKQGDEKRRKRFEPSSESERISPRSGNNQASKKSSKHVNLHLPVPETDTGGKVEKTKGREITLSKELGKMAP